jgi:hypothetical protein
VLHKIVFLKKETAGGFDDRKGVIELMGNTGSHFPSTLSSVNNS